MSAKLMDVSSGAGESTLEAPVIKALRGVFDPEIPVNIYDLGLVYSLAIDETTHDVDIRMTLTAAGCPVAQTFPATVAAAVREVDGVGEVRIDLVFEPPWSQERMSEAARLQLGLL
jgi:FeS assembly SUF system protein